MKNKTLLIIGNGEQGRIIEEIVITNSLYTNVKFIDQIKKKNVLGSPDDLPKIYKLLNSKCDVFIAIGNNKERKKLYQKIYRNKIPFTTIIHPTAYVAKNVVIKKNVFIGTKCVINSSTILERGVYINTGCIIEHDNHIGEFSHLAPGVITGGGTRIGNRVFAGLGSIMRDHIHIGDDNIIGAGSVVTKSFSKKGSQIVGVPARINK